MVEAAARPADWVMAAIVGAAGLAPTLAAVRRGAMVALANKECLVCAGALLMAEVAAPAGPMLLPVDSEHNAIFQALAGERRDGVERLILTASGGPFRGWTRWREMARGHAEQAVAHPNWTMGAKISRRQRHHDEQGPRDDRGAPPVRACPRTRSRSLVHPQSIVHSLVAFRDGSVLAQLGAPDMRIPIAYTLGWPERIAAPAPRLDLAAHRPASTSSRPTSSASRRCGWPGGALRAGRRRRPPY